MGEVVQLRKAGVSVWGPIVKVAAVMFVLTKLAGIAYVFFFGAFVVPQLTTVLQAAHVDQAVAFEGGLLQITMVPLSYALLAAISPLVGWWVYSRVAIAPCPGPGHDRQGAESPDKVRVGRHIKIQRKDRQNYR